MSVTTVVGCRVIGALEDAVGSNSLEHALDRVHLVFENPCPGLDSASAAIEKETQHVAAVPSAGPKLLCTSSNR